MAYDVMVIGGGAAGLFCAIEAARRGRRVIVIEHSPVIGKKIAISGGGRCNFTNTTTRPDNFLSQNPNFCKSALARYTPQDFIELVEKHGIPYHEKKLGQLFCDGSAREIIEMLLDECESAGVEVLVSTLVETISKTEPFEVVTKRATFSAESLVIATGGLSIPKLGATDFGYKIARQFGLRVVQPRPGLVPLAYDKANADGMEELSGISLDSIVSYERMHFRENTLLTHKGLSGPAILQISSYWQPGSAISINLLPDIDAESLLLNNHTGSDIASLLSLYLPRRFASAWVAANAPAKPVEQMSKSDIGELANRLHNWQLLFRRTEGFEKAEITVGGVDTNELSSKTMEARKVPGLYFIGEVVDVTGWLGGYNFQWAWASAFAAGQVV